MTTFVSESTLELLDCPWPRDASPQPSLLPPPLWFLHMVLWGLSLHVQEPSQALSLFLFLSLFIKLTRAVWSVLPCRPSSCISFSSHLTAQEAWPLSCRLAGTPLWGLGPLLCRAPPSLSGPEPAFGPQLRPSAAHVSVFHPQDSQLE